MESHSAFFIFIRKMDITMAAETESRHRLKAF
jgi:hypothetical protein